MKISYQVATPDVAIAPSVTSYQGDIAVSFEKVSSCGYHGVELMVRKPEEIDLKQIEKLSQRFNLEVPMICTGEVFGQDKLSFTDSDNSIRNEAIKRVRDAIDVAHELNSSINIGRVRGGYVLGVDRDVSYNKAIDAFLQLSDYAVKKSVLIALEPVNTLAINFINSTAEGLEMVKKINCPNFKLMLDTAHMFLEDKDMEKSVVDSKDHLIYVHLVDSNRKYPGACKIDFKSFMKKLKEIGYDEFVSIEVFQIPNQDEALIKSAEHIIPLL